MNDSSTLPQKRCSKCGEYFPATPEHFNRNKSQRDGLDTRCKACNREYVRAWRAANPEYARENSRAWRAVNPEYGREYSRAWRAANAEYRREYNRAYYAANAEAEREKSRVYRTTNPEHGREYVRAWRVANPEYARESSRAWRAVNPERAQKINRAWRAANPGRKRLIEQNRRARKRNLRSDFTLEQQRFALDYFHNSCAYCGRQFHDLFGERTLAFDHYIPLSSPDCPGTTASNMLPVCHGVDGCNTSKQARDPEEWLVDRFGKRKAHEIKARILSYFEIVSASASKGVH